MREAFRASQADDRQRGLCGHSFGVAGAHVARGIGPRQRGA
jgi:hypothetical protein